MNLRILFQRLTVTSYKTSYFEYCKEANVQTFNSLNNCLQDVLELTPAIDLTLRLLMSYIYGAPILDISRSHTTTQHSR